MNIHFDNKETFEELKRITIFKTIVGSHMYGLNDKYSDMDILYVYLPSIEELTSISKNNHQYQYKEEGINHIFVSIYDFILNSLSGHNDLSLLDSLITTKTIEWRLKFGSSHYFTNLKNVIYDSISNGIQYDKKYIIK